VEELVEIPYAPRPLQKVIHEAMDAHRFGAVVCHRRFGKTVLAVNHLQKCAMTCTRQRPRFGYIAPTYTQGKRIAWDYMKEYAHPVVDSKAHESELRIDYHGNGGQMRIFGADNPDALRGMYLDGVVFDEYGLMPSNIYSEVVRPLLSDRQGWALFMGTPNGKNQFYDVVQTAQREPDWFFAEYKASQTGYVAPAELEAARKDMTQDEYDQEFECSFEASVKGAVFMREMQLLRDKGQITVVPYDPALAVDTDWDLGYRDATAIWFSQTVRATGQIRLIDYYENTGYGLDHYREVLNRKNYSYGEHWAPHDIEVKELGSGNSRRDIARQMGLQFLVTPRVEKKADAIHATRLMLARCYFDAQKCERGIEALKNYRWDWNEHAQSYTNNPIHDWASHGADALQGLAFRWYQRKYSPERDAAAAVRAAQRDDWRVDRRGVRVPEFHHQRPTQGRGGY
jgi:phage terminase large subunit